ncbi:cytochrome P450 [Phycomyces nitens]|nr:cytochrome P450 [Phycomyces nitens]
MDQKWLEILERKDYYLPVVGAIAIGVAAKLVFGLLSSTSQDQKEIERLKLEGYKEIPSPSGKYPFFGHILSLGSTPSIKIRKWHQELGPIIRLNMGAQPWILISDPYLAHELFVKNGINTSDRHKHSYAYWMYSKGGKGIIFNNPGKKWKSTRSAALSILSPKHVHQFEGVIEAMIDTTIKLVRQDTEKEGAIFPEAYMKMATYGTVLKAVFGKDVTSIDDPTTRSLIYITEKSILYAGAAGDIGAFFPSLAWIDRISSRKKAMEDVVNERDTLLKDLIRTANDGDANCLTKVAYSIKEEHDLDEMDLTILLNDVFGAGGDTTSMSLLWLFAILPQFPDVQKKIFEEVDAFITKNGTLPSFSARDEFPYTVAVLRENIRFRCVTNFGIPHYTANDVNILGYHIPKNTVLISSMYAMHMNSSIYEDPEKFIPERFLNMTKSWTASSSGSIQERDMYAFGWGRRICPGIHLAEMMIFNMCVRLLSQCTIEPSLDKNGKPEFVDLDNLKTSGIVFSPQDYKVRFSKRVNSPFYASL